MLLRICNATIFMNMGLNSWRYLLWRYLTQFYAFFYARWENFLPSRQTTSRIWDRYVVLGQQPCSPAYLLCSTLASNLDLIESRQQPRSPWFSSLWSNRKNITMKTAAILTLLAGSAAAFAPAPSSKASTSLQISSDLDSMVGVSVETGGKAVSFRLVGY